MKADVHADAPGIAAGLFERRFSPVAESVSGLHAASAPIVAERLGSMVGAGEVTYQQAERMMGYLMLGAAASNASRHTIWRRRKQLREHGLVLVDPLEDPVEVDLGGALDAALAAWSSE